MPPAGERRPRQVAWPGGTAAADVHGPTMPRCDAPSLKSHVSATAFTSE